MRIDCAGSRKLCVAILALVRCLCAFRLRGLAQTVRCKLEPTKLLQILFTCPFISSAQTRTKFAPGGSQALGLRRCLVLAGVNWLGYVMFFNARKYFTCNVLQQTTPADHMNVSDASG